MVEPARFELEFYDKKYFCELTQARETLVKGRIVRLPIQETDEEEIKTFLNVCIEGERFFVGLEILLNTMALQRELRRIPRKNFDTDYDFGVYRDITSRKAIGFNISYKDERKEISVDDVRKMLENATNYSKIKDMISILRALF